MTERLSPREAHLRLIALEQRRDLERDTPREVVAIKPQKRLPNKLRHRRTTVLSTRDALRLAESHGVNSDACSWIRAAIIERLTRIEHGDKVLDVYIDKLAEAEASIATLREALRDAHATLTSLPPTHKSVTTLARLGALL